MNIERERLNQKKHFQISFSLDDTIHFFWDQHADIVEANTAYKSREKGNTSLRIYEY